MTALHVIKPGLQTSIQAGPFTGMRNQAIPGAGAADPLSLALANRLVGKPFDAAGLEITLGNATFKSTCTMTIAITGARANVSINAQPITQHAAIPVQPGDEIAIGNAQSGCRIYLAISRDIAVPMIFERQSTYMPARIGGFEGRALQAGDMIALDDKGRAMKEWETPKDLCPLFGSSALLRVVEGPESRQAELNIGALTAQSWRISRRSNRMGIKLEGEPIKLSNSEALKSSPVFAGAIQCPPDGQPYLLGVDGQTTGGYPRIAQVIRADRHLIGQLAPGAHVLFASVSSETAREIYRAKTRLWAGWLPGLSLY